MSKAKIKSLNTRLKLLLLVCFVPLTSLLITVLFMINRFSVRYDRVVEDLASANMYNITFKEELDYTVYIIAVNSKRAEELVDTELPHNRIQNARTTFQNLYNSVQDTEAKRQIKGILQNLDNLEKHINIIENNAAISGKYEENMSHLDMDVRILTELIQEQIQQYISSEIEHLESLRRGLRSDVKQAVLLNGISLLAILGIAVFLSQRIMKKTTEGIRKLQEVTQAAGKGEFHVRAKMEESDEELAKLGDGFNQMVEQLDTLVEHIRIEQRNIRMMEQKLLQAQINPHFLYNTLDAIIWLAESGEDKQVIMMVSALSDFFRTTLSKGKDIITVEEERSHIESYLKIQQFRYQDILEYEIDIPKEMYPYRIKKLMLQPLVENALYHGIKNKRGMGRITVKGWCEGEKLCFSVEDNGIGMKPERLEAVRMEISAQHSDENEPAGFGLYNVAQRIHLNYGSEYGLSLESEYQKGTTVFVSVPMKWQEEEIS